VENQILKNYLGKSYLRFVNALSTIPDGTELHVGGYPADGSSFDRWEFVGNATLAATNYAGVDRATYSFALTAKNGTHFGVVNGTMDTLNGAAWSIVLYGSVSAANLISAHIVTDMPPNSVSMFWQVPQYVLITIGEILFEISGQNFAYSQAPPAMRSIITAFWFQTATVGNLLVIIIVEMKIPSAVGQFILFAAFILIDMVIFAVLAYFYVYVDYAAKPRLLPEKCDRATADRDQDATASIQLLHLTKKQ
jgi:hypothetical protein